MRPSTRLHWEAHRSIYDEISRKLHGELASALQLYVDRRYVQCGSVAASVCHLQSARIEEDDVFYTLRQIKRRADLCILLLKVLAQYFQDGLGNLWICFVDVGRLFAKNRQVRTLKRAVREFDIGVRYLKAPEITVGQSFQAGLNAKNSLLVPYAGERLPGGNS